MNYFCFFIYFKDFKILKLLYNVQTIMFRINVWFQ